MFVRCNQRCKYKYSKAVNKTNFPSTNFQKDMFKWFVFVFVFHSEASSYNSMQRHIKLYFLKAGSCTKPTG